MAVLLNILLPILKAVLPALFKVWTEEKGKAIEISCDRPSVDSFWDAERL